MIRRPPRSTLFPYTPLSGSARTAVGDPDGVGRRAVGVDRGGAVVLGDAEVRSREHTSELQSHSDLVCRLLLENRSIHACRLLAAAACDGHVDCHGDLIEVVR